MPANNYELVTDKLTMIVLVANRAQNALMVVPSSASESVYCIRSLRSDPGLVEAVFQRAGKLKFFTSWQQYVRHEPDRWRSGHRMRCSGCGKYLARHK